VTRRLALSAPVVALLALGACGSPAGSLLGGQAGGGVGGGAPGTGAVSPTGAGGGNGGSGGAGGAPVDAGPKAPTPEQLFNTLEAPLVAACGTCHGTTTGLAAAPKWLLGPNRYATVKAYPGIVVSDPENSLLITIGDTVQHAGGPGLSNNPPADLRDQVTNWLEAEAAAIEAAPLASTNPFPLKNGANTVDISKGGVKGASMSFTVALGGGIVTFTDMTITAPANTGLEIVHPIFAIDTGAAGPPTGDVGDSFSNLDETVPAGQTMPLGVGLLVLDVSETIGSNWTSADKIVIQFTSLSKVAASDGGTEGGAGGCKAVATFTADAVPAIQANQCLTCHQGENPSATANLDLTMIGTDNAAACAQALTQVNLTTPSNSNIILAPTGGIAAHPFKGASANFKTMMLDWIMAE
jgi:cytochrome c553